jgi:hypothetical protein
MVGGHIRHDQRVSRRTPAASYVNMTPNYPSKQIKRVSAGSRNSSEAVYTVEEVLGGVAMRSG